LHNARHQNGNAKLPVIDAIKIDHLQKDSSRQNFTYCVVKISSEAAEKRSVRRCRTRLRSGSVLDPCNVLLSDCQIYDRSERGARIRLVRDISVPSRLRLYEDWPEKLWEAKVIWRKEREVGLCFDLKALSRTISGVQLACLRGRFYNARKSADLG